MIRALYGGSFDPFHNGHLALVHHLLDGGWADRVVVVPAARSPHRLPAPRSTDAKSPAAEPATRSTPWPNWWPPILTTAGAW
jgi:cytidyltransferase-like protein